MSISLTTPELRSNFRNLYADIFWFGILSGSSMSFLAIYAARLGATGFQISLLTAGPAIVNLLLSLPAGRWLGGRPLLRTSFITSFWHRLWYLVLVPLPWLFASRQQVWMMVAITLLMSIPGTVLAIVFNAAFADIVPPDWRAQVVGKRNALFALTSTSTSLVCGQLLDQIAFPLNYQVVFALGAAGAMMSTYHLARLRLTSEPLPGSSQRLRDATLSGVRRFLLTLRRPLGLGRQTSAQVKPLLRLDLLDRPFRTFMGVYFLFYTFQFSAQPIYPLFFVSELNLTDGQISLGSALFYGAMLLASMGLSRWSSRFGHHGTLVSGALLFGLYPLLTSLARGPTLFWVASLVGGVTWAITSGGLVNRLMERAPEADRPAYMVFHNLALNLGILCGSMAGPLLAEWMGLRPMLMLSAGLRLLGGILLIFWG